MALPLRIALQGDLRNLPDTVLKLRALRAPDCGAARFPIHRRVRFAVRRPLESLFDDLALRSQLLAQRLDTASLLLEGPGVLVSAEGRRKPGYTSGRFDIWAESLDRLAAVRTRLLDVIDEQQVREEIFTIDWHFHSPHMGLESVEFDELADPDLFDEAYPTLGEPVASFIERFLNGAETVLVLQGPPGTGKTRLVRAILAALSRRKSESAKVLYTADRRALENEAIFVIDEALVRPGRCFGVVRTRGLERDELVRLLLRLCDGDTDRAKKLADAALPAEGRGATLAEVFRVMSEAEAER